MPESNSYLTVLELDKLVRDNFTSSSDQAIWLSKLTAEDKSVICKQMTEYIDGLFLVGCKESTSQPLQFPRVKFGNVIDITETKLLLGAFKVMSQHYLSLTETNLSATGIKKYSVAGSSIEYFDNAQSSTNLNSLYRNYPGEFSMWVY